MTHPVGDYVHDSLERLELRTAKLEQDVERIIGALDRLAKIGQFQMDHNKLVREALSHHSIALDALAEALEKAEAQ